MNSVKKLFKQDLCNYGKIHFFNPWIKKHSYANFVTRNLKWSKYIFFSFQCSKRLTTCITIFVLGPFKSLSEFAHPIFKYKITNLRLQLRLWLRRPKFFHLRLWFRLWQKKSPSVDRCPSYLNLLSKKACKQFILDLQLWTTTVFCPHELVDCIVYHFLNVPIKDHFLSTS